MISWGDGFDQIQLNREIHRAWLEKVCLCESRLLGELSIELVDDQKLLEINKTYLDHDYYTDIITFDYSYKETVTGQLWISIDRVIENANFHGATAYDELNRVIVHGVLHLIGYGDSSERKKNRMRELEDNYLELLKEM